MAARLLRIGNCSTYLARRFIVTQLNRNFASRSDNLSADAAAATAASEPQRKFQIKESADTNKLKDLFNAEIRSGDIVPVFKRALLYGDKIAIKDTTGEYSYRQILEAARKLSVHLSSYSGGKCSKRFLSYFSI